MKRQACIAEAIVPILFEPMGILGCLSRGRAWWKSAIDCQSDCWKVDRRCRIELLENPPIEPDSTFSRERGFAVAAIDDRLTLTKTSSTPITGADVLVESLVRHGVEVVFAYPGGASMPLHQALTRYRDRIRTILPRHEQGGSSRPRDMPGPAASRAW